MEQTLIEINKKMDLLSTHLGLEMAKQMKGLAEELELNFKAMQRQIEANHQDLKKVICKR